MLDYLIRHTDFLQFLSVVQIGQLREVSHEIKTFIETRQLPVSWSWIEKCRHCDPHTMWNLDGKSISCLDPCGKQEWLTIYWKKKIPSIVPHSFWSYFLQCFKGFMTLSKFQKWRSFHPSPVIFPDRSGRMNVRMRVEIVGSHIHRPDNENGGHFKDIDEFVSVGISTMHTEHIQDSILGLNSFSIGWHSDDGNIYMDSLVLSEGLLYGAGDTVDVRVNYGSGTISFEKNNHVVYEHELSGDFLSQPLSFCIVSKTLNTLFFQIV